MVNAFAGQGEDKVSELARQAGLNKKPASLYEKRPMNGDTS